MLGTIAPSLACPGAAGSRAQDPLFANWPRAAAAVAMMDINHMVCANLYSLGVFLSLPAACIGEGFFSCFEIGEWVHE